MLALMLVLVSLRVTLLELLGWIAWGTGTTVAPSLQSVDLALLVFHLAALPLSHDSSINMVLKGREGMLQQQVVKGSTKPLKNMYCLLASVLTSLGA
jgi:hypothetical protein